MNSFLRTCWLSASLTTILVFGFTSLAWKSLEPKLPARPPMTMFGTKDYISSYANIGTTMHYIYRLGLFGVRERLRKSDVILLGSSHVEYGLSAAQLSKELSDFSGHPVTVYNAGIGCAEGSGFANDILVSNGLEKKAVVLDLFSPFGNGISAFGQTMRQSNSMQGYLHVLDLWLGAFSDDCLDSFLPRVATNDFTKYKFSRSLGITEIRNWDSGDVVELWDPALGVLFPEPAASVPRPRRKPANDTNVNAGVWFDATTQETISKLRLSPAYTVIPFGGFEHAVIPPDAEPFIPLSGAGLSYWDEQLHVTAGSREIVTDRLAQGLESAHLFTEEPAPRSR
jgi:hypothetical protein